MTWRTANFYRLTTLEPAPNEPNSKIYNTWLSRWGTCYGHGSIIVFSMILIILLFCIWTMIPLNTIGSYEHSSYCSIEDYSVQFDWYYAIILHWDIWYWKTLIRFNLSSFYFEILYICIVTSCKLQNLARPPFWISKVDMEMRQ